MDREPAFAESGAGAVERGEIELRSSQQPTD